MRQRDTGKHWHRTLCWCTPSFFIYLDLSSVWCVLAIWWTGPNVFALLCLQPCLVSSDGVTLWTCGSPKGTQHDGPGSVCLLRMVSRCGCSLASGMSTPSRCRGLGAQQVSMVVRPSWEQWFLRGCVCQSRSSNPHWLPQMVGRVGGGGMGTILWHSVVGLCRCGDGPL